MVEIKEKCCFTSMGDQLQKAICSHWINREFPRAMRVVRQEKWDAVRLKLGTKAMRFCIDRFEYPKPERANTPLSTSTGTESN